MAGRRFQRDEPKEAMDMPKGDKKDKGEKMGKLRAVHIRRAKNGWTSEMEHEPETGKKGEPMPYNPPEPMVHESKESLLSHLADCLED